MPERFSASVAARFMSCPASANLEAAIPNWTPPEVDATPAATRGTQLHEVMDPVLRLGTTDFKQVIAALTYVAELRGRRRFNAWVEHSVECDWLDSRPWTTADLILFVQDEMHIVDFKMGRIPVEVVDNKQLLYYAASYAHLAPRAKEITVHIVQPAADNFAEWTIDAMTLLRFVNDARVADAKITGGDTTFGPSDACTFCAANPHGRGAKGSPKCPAMMQLLYPAPPIDEDAILNS